MVVRSVDGVREVIQDLTSTMQMMKGHLNGAAKGFGHIANAISMLSNAIQANSTINPDFKSKIEKEIEDQISIKKSRLVRQLMCSNNEFKESWNKQESIKK